LEIVRAPEQQASSSVGDPWHFGPDPRIRTSR
jgi:hypothetical protein